MKIFFVGGVQSGTGEEVPRRALARRLGTMFGLGRQTKKSSRKEAQVVVEATSLLEGRVLRERRRFGQSVSAWVWLNTLSHGNLHQLRQLRHEVALELLPVADDGGLMGDAWNWEVSRDVREVRAWREAARELADEVLQVAHHDAQCLVSVQREALVPLELDLLDHPDPSLTPEGLVSRVRAALAA